MTSSGVTLIDVALSALARYSFLLIGQIELLQKDIKKLSTDPNLIKHSVEC